MSADECPSCFGRKRVGELGGWRTAMREGFQFRALPFSRHLEGDRRDISIAFLARGFEMNVEPYGHDRQTVLKVEHQSRVAENSIPIALN